MDYIFFRRDETQEKNKPKTKVYLIAPLHPPPFTLSHCAEYKYPVQLQKHVRGGGERGGGGGAFMYIFVFGLVFSVSYLSEGRYNPSFETCS